MSAMGQKRTFEATIELGVYTLAVSRFAAMGKANPPLLTYFPNACLVSAISFSRAASLACDTGPANGDPPT
jgi:hypothetical protein